MAYRENRHVEGVQDQEGGETGWLFRKREFGGRGIDPFTRTSPRIERVFKRLSLPGAVILSILSSLRWPLSTCLTMRGQSDKNGCAPRWSLVGMLSHRFIHNTSTLTLLQPGQNPFSPFHPFCPSAAVSPIMAMNLFRLLGMLTTKFVARNVLTAAGR
jgi:hypothetical protein